MPSMHVCMSIAWLERKLAEFKRADRRRLWCFDCFGMSDTQVYESLVRYKAQWYDAIPSEWCDNVDERWHCKWHK